jgi:small conductance mechanosensitive channel
MFATTTVMADEATTTYQAQTTKNINISDEEFEITISYLNKQQLFIEADAWLKLLEKAAKDVAVARLSVKKQNQIIQAQEDEVEAKKDEMNASEQNSEAIKKAEDITQESKKKKLNSLGNITKLRETRTAISDKLNLILMEINERIGTQKDGKELDEVLVYRRYMNSVGGVSIDVDDSTSTLVNITGWLTSAQGGIRWLINLATFLGIIVFTMLISFVLKNIVKKALRASRSKSKLLNDFIVNIVGKIVMLGGILIALSALEINIAPIMAIVGAAGFVIAFALQGTLSNFASGIMMMIYRPFDIGDTVDVAGIIGTVKSMNLVSTTIMTADNRSMLIPNNTIWGSVITNFTSSGTRRVDMTFGIGYGDDMQKAQNILQELVESHPLVLQEPKPTIKVHELADSSVNFICRPWVKTSDYWPTYWEITRAVKERFDSEGISIPFPQTDVHIIHEAPEVPQEHTIDSVSKNFSDTKDRKSSHNIAQE